MRYWLSIIVIGTIIAILGIIFHFQGQAVVGPESSFMYANPEWENYGIQIAIVGGIVLGVGIVMRFLKK